MRWEMGLSPEKTIADSAADQKSRTYMATNVSEN